MLIPHLHFNGCCAEALALYENVFETKASNFDYTDGKIAHAEINIHGQTVWLNDNREQIIKNFRIGGTEGTPSEFLCTAHLVLTFGTKEELLDCYEKIKTEADTPLPFSKTPYSELSGNFLDRFGVLWGFIVTRRT